MNQQIIKAQPIHWIGVGVFIALMVGLIGFLPSTKSSPRSITEEQYWSVVSKCAEETGYARLDDWRFFQNYFSNVIQPDTVEAKIANLREMLYNPGSPFTAHAGGAGGDGEGTIPSQELLPFLRCSSGKLPG